IMSKQLNEADRIAICHKKRENPDITQVQLVKWVKEKLGKFVTQATISNTLKHSINILAEDMIINSKRQRQRKVMYPELEERLFEWILKFQHTGQLTGETLKTKAIEIATHLYSDELTLTFSAGWLEKFKKHHGIRQFVTHGESGS
ncbi:2291_t:CDS:1, partial [Acaulospora morrowiae]